MSKRQENATFKEFTVDQEFIVDKHCSKLSLKKNLVNVKTSEISLINGLVKKWVLMLTLLKISFRSQFGLQLMVILLLK